MTFKTPGSPFWWVSITSPHTGKRTKRSTKTANKKEADALVSGYDAVLRFRIIKRWQELESQPTAAFDLATMTAGALRELAAKVEECALLKADIILQYRVQPMLAKTARIAFNLTGVYYNE